MQASQIEVKWDIRIHVETYEVKETNPCGEDNRAVEKKTAGEDGALRELELPEDDDGEEEDADNKHGNHGR